MVLDQYSVRLGCLVSAYNLSVRPNPVIPCKFAENFIPFGMIGLGKFSRFAPIDKREKKQILAQLNRQAGRALATGLPGGLNWSAIPLEQNLQRELRIQWFAGADPGVAEIRSEG